MNLSAGSGLKPFRVEAVTADSMKAWAVFLRDPNPIHLDPAAVKAKGLGDRTINQGPANLAYLINMLMVALPGARLVSLEVRYVDNVYCGDAVEAGGLVQAIANGTVSCEVWLRADGRGPVLTGSAVLAF